MTYEKEEAPRRTTILQKGLMEINHHSNSNTVVPGVNTPVKAQGKIIGYLRDHTFIKRVIGSKHKLRKPPAWCISKEAFCEQVMPNTENVIVEDIESGLVYECPTEVFAERAFEIQRGGFEPQLALTLNYWKKQSNGHRQLSLWGGVNGVQ
jgi:hypothetical protein